MIPKFRAWDKNTKKMNGMAEIYRNRKQEIELLPRDDNTILMQSTGILDKNGLEIFEGDLIKFEVPNKDISGIYEVRRAKSGEWRMDNRLQGRTLYISGSHNCEIIGNVYQNPELLEEYDEME